MTLKNKLEQCAAHSETLWDYIKEAHSLACANESEPQPLEILIYDLIEDIANLTNRIHRINSACK